MRANYKLKCAKRLRALSQWEEWHPQQVWGFDIRHPNGGDQAALEPDLEHGLEQEPEPGPQLELPADDILDQLDDECDYADVGHSCRAEHGCVAVMLRVSPQRQGMEWS